MDVPPGEITRLLTQLKAGDRAAEVELAPLVYDEIKRIAAAYMRNEREGHTLQATALAHEAYMRLLGAANVDWQSRAHFYAVTAQMMRRILVDYARARQALKRPDRRGKVSLESALVYAEEQSAELLALDEALTRLSVWDGRLCRVVELRFFAGMSLEETAEVVGVSTRTVKRDWNIARAWLYRQLTGIHDDGRAVGST